MVTVWIYFELWYPVFYEIHSALVHGLVMSSPSSVHHLPIRTIDGTIELNASSSYFCFFSFLPSLCFITQLQESCPVFCCFFLSLALSSMIFLFPSVFAFWTVFLWKHLSCSCWKLELKRMHLCPLWVCDLSLALHSYFVLLIMLFCSFNHTYALACSLLYTNSWVEVCLALHVLGHNSFVLGRPAGMCGRYYVTSTCIIWSVAALIPLWCKSSGQ